VECKVGSYAGRYCRASPPAPAFSVSSRLELCYVASHSYARASMFTLSGVEVWRSLICSATPKPRSNSYRLTECNTSNLTLPPSRLLFRQIRRSPVRSQDHAFTCTNFNTTLRCPGQSRSSRCSFVQETPKSTFQFRLLTKVENYLKMSSAFAFNCSLTPVMVCKSSREGSAQEQHTGEEITVAKHRTHQYPSMFPRAGQSTSKHIPKVGKRNYSAFISIVCV
jgi:hypothetical protein